MPVRKRALAAAPLKWAGVVILAVCIYRWIGPGAQHHASLGECFATVAGLLCLVAPLSLRA